MTGGAKATSQDMIARLRARYTARPGEVVEWAFFEQVRAGTGPYAQRTADAIAMNLWESRGLAVHGFEVKVSRSDWLRELRQPEKADPLVSRVDYWWLLVSDPEIVKDGELPDGWGLMVPYGEKLRAVTDPKRRPDAKIDRGFVASLLRRVDRDELAARHVRDALARQQEEHERRTRSLTTENESFRARLEALHNGAGHRWNSAIPAWYDPIERWTEFGEKVAQQFEAPLEADRARDQVREFARRLQTQARQLLELIDEPEAVSS